MLNKCVSVANKRGREVLCLMVREMLCINIKSNIKRYNNAYKNSVGRRSYDRVNGERNYTYWRERLFLTEGDSMSNKERYVC